MSAPAPMPISPETRAQLLAQADHLAEELALEYGRSRVGTVERIDGRWSVEVRGLLDDIEMRGYRVWPSGATEPLA